MDKRPGSWDARVWLFAALTLLHGAALTPAGESPDPDATGHSGTGSSGATPPPAGVEASPSDLQPPSAPADIVVSQTPNGLIVTSTDRQALDDFEQLLRTLLETAAAGPDGPTIFWLRFAQADVAAELLSRILNGAANAGAPEAGGAPTGADAVGGGIIGSVLRGAGPSLRLSGPASIVPDVRLNALIVQAGPADLRLIEDLLSLLDREASPEPVQTTGKPQLIPVIYMPAEEIADVIRQVYSSRMAGAEGNRQRSPSPEEFLQAMRGGGRDGTRGQSAEATQKMTLGVDSRSNSLIVAAPEPLLQEIKGLVAQLDNETVMSDETVAVVGVKQANPALIQKALTSLVGQTTRMIAGNANRPGGSTSGPPGGGTPFEPPNMIGDVQRQMDFLRGIGERMGGAGGPGAFGGAGMGSPQAMGGMGGESSPGGGGLGGPGGGQMPDGAGFPGGFGGGQGPGSMGGFGGPSSGGGMGGSMGGPSSSGRSGSAAMSTTRGSRGTSGRPGR